MSFIKPDGSADVWYVSKQKNSGFTSLQEEALVDGRGRPVIASGHVRLLAGAMTQAMRENIHHLWEHYLDLMEENYEHQEARATMVNNYHQAKMEGVLEALCIMEYGKHVSDETRKLILRQAKIRYEMETE